MQFRFSILCLLAASTMTANLASAQSMAPTKTDIENSMKRADQKKDMADHAARAEVVRPKSANEQFTNSIPKDYSVTPIYKNGGGGVNVTVPTGNAIQK